MKNGDPATSPHEVSIETARSIIMKNLFFLLFFSCTIAFTPAQAQKTYQDGEWLKFRIHYGIFNASFATLEVHDTQLNGTAHYHVKGEGKSTGLLHAFFKVNDVYESYIDKKTGLPSKFIRDINEGGYTKDKVIYFDQPQRRAKVEDRKHGKEEAFDIQPNVQDMISVFYHVRDQIDQKLKKEGDEMVVNMFFDETNYKFKTVFLGEKTIRTKFGKIKTLKLRPYVQSGRVFKEQESLTVYVSADKNKVPVQIKAKLSVGSLKADLYEYKNLKYPFEIIVD